MIFLDAENNATVAVCDTCGVQISTGMANGVVPAGWMTGHLWLDISLAEQRQQALCFCPACTPSVKQKIVLSLAEPEVAGSI